MHSVLIAAQILILLVIGALLGQVWKLLVRKDVPDDEPLSEKQVDTLQKKLKLLTALVVAEATVSIIQIILRFIEAL